MSEESTYNQPIDSSILYKSYVVLADKNTPENILLQLKDLCKSLDLLNFVMRSPGNRIPSIYIDDVCSKKEIYLPWKEFKDPEDKEDRYLQYYPVKKSKFERPVENDKCIIYYRYPDKAEQTALFFNNRMPLDKAALKAILIRNTCLVLGKDLKSLTSLVLCWTPDGAEEHSKVTFKTGYTGNVISIASKLKIPVFNLYNQDAKDRLIKYTSTLPF